MNAPERVVLVAANPQGARTGNEIALLRTGEVLRRAGADVVVARPGDTADEVAARVATGPRPALVHGFHARRSGPRALELAQRLHVPLVLSVTGTDLAIDVHRADRAPVVTAALRAAAGVVCGHADEVDAVRAAAPGVRVCRVIPKSVHLPASLPAPTLPRTADEVLVLVVAHVRRVKNVATAVRAVRAAGPPLRLVVLGDVLEPEAVPELVRDAGGADAWARTLVPAVPHAEVGGCLVSADLVLNTSDSEGGSNAILEAFAHGRPVVASDVPGNAAFVGTDGSRGVLYPVRRGADGGLVHDERELAHILRELARDAPRRARMGAAARAWVGAQHSEEAEREALLALYAAALNRDSSGTR
mgnify:CR=1 FL=1